MKTVNSEKFNQWLVDYQSNLPSRPLIMGVLNVTPDSFSDGGKFLDPTQACKQAILMIKQGADIIDIGGESSKPGALPVTSSEELARVIPVIEQIRAISDVCISVDTCKAQVMEEAVIAGASLINDISAFSDPAALAIAANHSVPICLMHMKGSPQTMQEDPQYVDDVVLEINDFFQQRIQACVDAGIARERIIIDPGFGFGKTIQHNMLLVRRLVEFQQHNQPVLLGVSRKSTLGAILEKPVNERLIGGIVISVLAALQGVALIRTHDVDETQQALKMIQAIVSA